MKAPKEIRKWVNNIRKRQGKKNGVIKYLWELIDSNKSKTEYVRHQKHKNNRNDHD